MLKLRKPMVIKIEEPKKTKEVEKPKDTKKSRKLPPDTYKEEFEPVQIIVDENSKLNFSVKRGGDLGLPRLDIRQYMTTDFYTGFTQKGLNLPVELLDELIETLEWVRGQCEDRNLMYDESEEDE